MISPAFLTVTYWLSSGCKVLAPPTAKYFHDKKIDSTNEMSLVEVMTRLYPYALVSAGMESCTLMPSSYKGPKAICISAVMEIQRFKSFGG